KTENHISTSLRALSFATPYRCCSRPSNWSRCPLIAVRSSSVSLPHFSLTLPFISFHFPSTRFQSIAVNPLLLDPLYQRSLAASVPGTFSSHRQNGAQKARHPFSASGFVHMW